MRIKIKKGKHFPFPYFYIPRPIFICKNKYYHMEGRYIFDKSCFYNLGDDDQYDTNKLFGFSIGHHHKDSSFRFGWRPNIIDNKIELIAYEYVNGKRNKIKILQTVDIDQQVKLRINYNSVGHVLYFVNNQLKAFHNYRNTLNKKNGWGYKLGIYFGGNKSAPHDIIIYKCLSFECE